MNEQDQLKRRVFLGRVAVKAAYVAPAALALRAARTGHAGGASCGTAGSPCDVDAECCTGLNCEQGGMACMGMMNCSCA